MLFDKYFALLLTAGALVVAPSYASSITSFTFTPTSGPFTSVLVDSSSSSQASVTGSVTCASTSICSGEVGEFSLGLDLNEPSNPFSAEISGDNLGVTTASGVLEISGYPTGIPFSFKPGDFDKVLIDTTLPELGNSTVDGSLDLSLAPGQEITLPLTFSVGTQVMATPEPSGVALLLAGLVALGAFMRHRNRAPHAD